MRRLLAWATLAVLLTLSAVAAIRAQSSISGSATLTVIGSSGNSLLSGCNYIGSGGCSVPAGWTLVMQQDFECGGGSHASPSNSTCSGSSLPANEDFDVSTNPTVFENVQAHSGANGWGSLLAADGQQSDWLYNREQTDSNLASFTSVYISYWDYTDANAMFGSSDYFLGGLQLFAGCGIGFDAEVQNSATDISGLTTIMLATPDGEPLTGCVGNFLYNQGFTLTINAGRWEQKEMLLTPSTTFTNPVIFPPPNCNSLSPSTPGCGNGAIELWINGQNMINAQNVNVNGSGSYLKSAVLVGGVITSFDPDGTTRCVVWSSNGSPTVSSTGTVGLTSLGVTVPGACNGTQPGSGSPQPFHRYFDDIIILKR